LASFEQAAKLLDGATATNATAQNIAFSIIAPLWVNDA